MKCLSLAQPFADLVVSGKKRVELRSWNTRFRGEFLVHAAQRVRRNDVRRLGMDGAAVTGAVIGRAEVIGVKEYSTEKELRGDDRLHFSAARLDELVGKRKGGGDGGKRCVYGFMLDKARRFRLPAPYKGRLKFFDADIREDAEYLPSDDAIKAEIMDEECRYQWINHH